jgi:hypothetical protein
MQRLPALALLLLLVPSPDSHAETLTDSLREQREQAQREDARLDDANQRNNPGSAPKVPQWYLDELRQRESSVNTHYEEYKRQRAVRMREEYEAFSAKEKSVTESKAAARAENYAAIAREIATASAEDLRNPWYFSALMDRAWPDPYTMRFVADNAIQWHPQAWLLRHGMLVAATCDTPAPDDMSHYLYGEKYAAHCIATRHRAGFDGLRAMLKSPSVLERALYCTALHASLAAIVDARRYVTDSGLQQVQGVDEQSLLADIAACEATLPAGHAFDEGLFRPAQAYGAFRTCDFATASWLLLFDPVSWQGVNLTDATALRENLDRLYTQQRPAGQCYADKPSWTVPLYTPGWDPLEYDQVPQRAEAVAQRMDEAQARKLLGKPESARVQLQRRDVPGAVRDACMGWRDRDGVSALSWKKKFKSGVKWHQTTTVYFDRDGKACASYATQLSTVKNSKPNHILPIPVCSGCVARRLW